MNNNIRLFSSLFGRIVFWGIAVLSFSSCEDFVLLHEELQTSVYDRHFTEYRYYITIILHNNSETPIFYETCFPISEDYDNHNLTGFLNSGEKISFFDGEIIKPMGHFYPTIYCLNHYPYFSDAIISIYDYDPDNPSGKGKIRFSSGFNDLCYITLQDFQQNKNGKIFYTEFSFFWNNPAMYTYNEDE